MLTLILKYHIVYLWLNSRYILRDPAEWDFKGKTGSKIGVCLLSITTGDWFSITPFNLTFILSSSQDLGAPSKQLALLIHQLSIIVDSKSDDIVRILQQMVSAFNSNNVSGDSVVLDASWYLADIDNTCDLIRAICKRLDSGVFLLLGSSSSRAYNTIQSYSQALHVPYLLFSETANRPGDSYRYDLSVSPSYVRPVADLVKFFNWEEMFYIFDADDALLELQSFHDLFRSSAQDIVVDARRLRNVASSHDLLRRLDMFSKPYKRIILNLSSPEAYQSILNQIVDVGMNRDNYHYLLFGPKEPLKFVTKDVLFKLLFTVTFVAAHFYLSCLWKKKAKSRRLENDLNQTGAADSMHILFWRWPPSDQGAGAEARTRKIMVPADLKADSQATVPLARQEEEQYNDDDDDGEEEEEEKEEEEEEKDISLRIYNFKP
ncbi:glutamate receptor subunit protein glur2 [Plakobranchus ocellatus]|uniref:Glutamate receptor subunit protein glur2 n=1 Tax=Plakobranchus ocellatus TaxID=259542 RepID=A0AAV3YA89_9GAST|nr:glutamate receptor subunit protein glur2 [Plakobranchus ocellatus]